MLKFGEEKKKNPVFFLNSSNFVFTKSSKNKEKGYGKIR